MKVSTELNRIITTAFAEAKARSHEYITPEHILYASLFSSQGIDIISNCGGDIERMKKELDDFFKEGNIPVVKKGEPIQSEGFQNLIENAMLHVASAGKEELEIGDIFAALFYEKESFAVSFLEQDGITRFNILNYISHGISLAAGNDYLQKAE
ncbi:MAG: ATP-dependent Clp protease ATP-binding subunit ClpA, partial [Candidatus Aminicenantes bacterium]|nr:ATP-dependent Clp protease ATP-binding subunit ClpA [Candidatus Aminicenantes bacterium]